MPARRDNAARDRESSEAVISPECFCVNGGSPVSMSISLARARSSVMTTMASSGIEYTPRRQRVEIAVECNALLDSDRGLLHGTCRLERVDARAARS